MDIAQLANSPVGRLVEVSGYDGRFDEDYRTWAFLPDPLPERLDLPASAHKIVAEAAAWVARADQAVGSLPSPALVVRPTIRREAVDTSALEGTFAAFTDVLEADFLSEDELSRPVSEVHNFVLAAEHALLWIANRPVTLDFLEDTQKLLVRGTPADSAEAGHVRTTNVMIGLERNQRVHEARFVVSGPHM